MIVTSNCLEVILLRGDYLEISTGDRWATFVGSCRNVVADPPFFEVYDWILTC